MSILNLQQMEPTAIDSAVAVISCTSSGHDCCQSPKEPGV